MPSRSGNGRYIIYLLLFSMLMINYIDRVTLSVAAKSIATEYGLSPVQMGYLFSSFLWTYVLCLIPAGMLVDRIGVRKVCAGGLALWSLSTIVTGLSSSFAMLVATRLTMGAGESTSYPAAGRAIQEWAPQNERGFAMAIFNSGAYAGPAVGALLMGWLISRVGWKTAFVIAGASAFVWLVAWLAFYRQPERANPAGKRGETAIAPQRGQRADSKAARGSSLGTLLRSPSVWGVALTQGCAVYTQYLFLTWLPGYLQSVRHFDIKSVGAYTALPYVGAVLLGILLGKLSDHLMKGQEPGSGKRRKMIATLLLSSSVILLTPFVSQLWLIMLLFTVSLTGISTAIAMNVALTCDLLESSADAGKATSIATLGGNIFGLLAPIVTGYVIAGTGSYGMAFVVAGALLVCGAVISLRMTRQKIGCDPVPQGLPAHL
jgi:ACS family glucarate transporter-like MFS transporter